jgi:hypothetical protein
VVRLQWWGGGGRVNWRCSDSSLPKLVGRNEHHRDVPYAETKPPPLVRLRVVPGIGKPLNFPALILSLLSSIWDRNWEHHHARLFETKLLPPILPTTVAGIAETHRSTVRFPSSILPPHASIEWSMTTYVLAVLRRTRWDPSGAVKQPDEGGGSVMSLQRREDPTHMKSTVQM